MKALIYGCWFFWIIVLLNVAVSSCDDKDDDNQEQDGVYDYSYIQQQPCDERVISPGHGSWKRYGFIMADGDGCYNPNTNCLILLNVSSSYQITLRIQQLYSLCGGDLLQIFDEADSRDYCGSSTPLYSLYSSSSLLKIRFHTGPAISNVECMSGFRLYYTAYHTGECTDDEFRCAIDGRCIPKELKCDKYDNCGDWSDEKAGACGLSTGAIIAIAVMSALVGLSLIAFLCYCIYVRVTRRKSTSARRENATRSIGPPSTRTRRENAIRSRGPPADLNDEPLGLPGYTEPPPAYTVVNTVYAGVYDEPYEQQDTDVDAPPSYQSVAAVTAESSAT